MRRGSKGGGEGDGQGGVVENDEEGGEGVVGNDKGGGGEGR